MLSSATACAPITAHNATGSVSNLAAFAEAGAAGATTTTSPVQHITTSLSEQSRPLQGLAERFHGLTERLGSLGGSSAGHSRTESDASNRTRTGKKKRRRRKPNNSSKTARTSPYQCIRN